jgi:hypothetical protein
MLKMAKTGLIAGALVFAGCMSWTTYQTAETTPPGGMTVGGGLSSICPSTDIFFPVADIFVRFGLSPSADMGFRYNTPFRMTLDTKMALSKSFAFDVAIGGVYAPMHLHRWVIVNVMPSVILSTRLSDVMSLYLVPKLSIDYIFFAEVDEMQVLPSGMNWIAGTTLGLALGRRFKIMPEITMVQWVSPESFFYLQPGIGFSYTFK